MPPSEYDRLTPGEALALQRAGTELLKSEEELRLEHTKILARASGARF